MNQRARLGYIAVADAVLLLVGIVGVVAVHPGAARPLSTVAADGSTATTAATPTSTVPPAAAQANAIPTAATPAAKAGAKAGTTATTAKAGSSGGAGPSSAGQPPKDGSYKMHSHADSTGGPQGAQSTDNDTTLTYTTVKRSPQEIEDKVDRKSNGADAGSSSELWRPDGVYGRGGKSDCTPPERVILKLPLGVGVSWTNTDDCTTSGPSGSTVKSHSVATSKVVASKAVQAAGRSVQVWEIDSTTSSTATYTYNGTDQKADTTITSKELFAPAYGLLVHADGTSKTQTTYGSVTSTFTQDLQNLDPA